MPEHPNYPDLYPGALVSHPVYGTGRIVFEEWEYGQPKVAFDDGRTIFCNPDRLSTDAED